MVIGVIMDEHNFSQLKRAYQEDEVFQLVCDHFSNRSGNQYNTKVDTLFRHIKRDSVEGNVKRSQVVRALRFFENAGGGRYIKSKYGSTFEWSIRTKELCERIAENDEWDIVFFEKEEEQRPDGTPTLIHKFHLREDYIVDIELPVDLTETEAFRLSNFTGTLSFGDDS